MSYIITVRNHRGTKIARQIEVDSDTATVKDVIEEALHQERVKMLLVKMKVKGTRNIRYYWCPELGPPLPQPPPKPEPVKFGYSENRVDFDESTHV